MLVYVEVEILVHKTLAIDLLKGGPRGPTPRSDRVNDDISLCVKAPLKIS